MAASGQFWLATNRSSGLGPAFRRYPACADVILVTPQTESRPAPLVPFLLVTAGVAVTTIFLGTATGESLAFFIVWAVYALAALITVAGWMARDVSRAGNNGLLVGVLFIVLWPLGVYLWATRRPPGPVWTRPGRWIVRALVAESIVVAAIVGGAWTVMALR